MWQKLVVEHILSFRKEFVRKALRIIDPDKVDSRLQHRHKEGSITLMARIMYGTLMGMIILRRIMWLEV